MRSRKCLPAILAALFLLTPFVRPASSPAIIVHAPVTVYTGVWQGQTVSLTNVTNVSVEQLGGVQNVGQLTDFHASGSPHNELNGKAVNVWTVDNPAYPQFAGAYVVHDGGQGPEPVYGTWTFPRPGGKQNLNLSVAVTPGGFTVSQNPQQVTWSVGLSQPVNDGTLALTVTSPDGKTTPIESGSGVTAGSCSFTNDWVFNAPGTWTVNASWSGDGQYNPASGSATVELAGTWSQVGSLPGDAARVTSLVNFAGSLYAGTLSDGVWTWNNSSWDQVGGPTGLPGQAADVNTLATPLLNAQALCAGTADGVWVLGNPWSQVGSGLTGYAAMVVSLLPYNGTLYAATHRGVWYLDGSTWTQLETLPGDGATPPDPASNLTGLATLGGVLYAGTSDGVWSWNGSSWSQSGSLPGDGTVRGLVALKGPLYAGTDNGVWSYTPGAVAQTPASGGRTTPRGRTGNPPIIIALRIGQSEYTVNGSTHTSSPAPFVENGRTFVPVDIVTQALVKAGWDLKTSWDLASRTASFSFGQRRLGNQPAVTGPGTGDRPRINGGGFGPRPASNP